MNIGAPVSLCMIVKNEAHCITSCIESARHLVQEIIVVDTGSTDATPEIAARYGAKIFTFPWRDDFAAARNYSLAQATGDWILVLDADEILGPVKAEEFGSLLAASEVEGYFVNIHSYLDNGQGVAKDQVVRLFRNKPAYRFEGAIHEQVAGAIKRHNNGEGLVVSDLVIHHFGYLNQPVQAKNKRQRNISVIKKALAEKPDDPFLLYSLGIEYFQCDKVAEGIGPLGKALALMHGGEGYFRDVLLALGLGLLRTGQTDRLMLLLDKALHMLPDDPELHLLKGILALRDSRHATAARELQYALTGGSQVLPPHHIHTLLGDAYNTMGRYGDAENEYFEALRLAPHVLYPLTQICGLIQRNNSRFGWLELSRFDSLSSKKVLREKLVKLGESPLALVLALLVVVEAVAAGDSGELATACREYHLTVKHCTETRSVQGLFGDYLLAVSDEMLWYVEAAHQGLSCGLFSAVQGIAELASATLELVVKGLCPPWSPTLNLRL